MTPTAASHAAALAAGRAVPLTRWVLADTETPVTAFAKLRPLGASVLLESVEGGERWGRYSIIGLASGRELRINRQGHVQLSDGVDGRHRPFEDRGDPFAAMRELFGEVELDDPPPEVGELPPFLGGWMGYLGYGAIHWIEPKVPDAKTEETPFPDACFLEIDRAVLFDNVRHAICVVAIVKPGDAGPEALLAAGEERIGRVVTALEGSLGMQTIALDAAAEEATFEPRQSAESFRDAVGRAVEEIQAGECIQVVLSQRFTAPLRNDPFTLYRALRLINPSPYLFFMDFPEGAMIGSSPEVLVRTDGTTATLRPIAGTRKRGATAAEDCELEKDLLNDPKELAEHVMLVDLGRNDLGRVSAPGSVRLTERMVVERYSHVMHIVSNIESELAPGTDALDLLRACFPAGTVSGAPKVRAMQLIEELEVCRRGPYSGAVGYFDHRGNMDTGIAIRTFFAYDDTLALQAGAGIVADSDPEKEYQETLSKARALFAAVRLVESGFAMDAQ